MKRFAVLVGLALVIGILAISAPPGRTLIGCQNGPPLQSLLPPHGWSGCGSERADAGD